MMLIIKLQKFITNTKIKLAFTSIELLLSLLIISLFIPLIFNLSFNLSKITKSEIQYASINQLQLILALADDVNLIDDVIYLNYLSEDMKIIIDKNRIVKKPGYQILMSQLKNPSFYEEFNCIYLSQNNHKIKLFCH